MFFPKRSALALLFLLIAFFSIPAIASAHEVYVLSPAEITQAIGTPSFDLLAVAEQNLGQFVFWAFIGILLVFGVFWISIVRFLERQLDPMLAKLRRFTPFIARFTIGVSFLAGAYYQATYGPELPLSSLGPWAGLVTVTLVVIGTLAILGLYMRIAAFIALVLYCVTVALHGSYMLTYVNYLGEIIVLLILGAHSFSLDTYLAKGKKTAQKSRSVLAIWSKKIQSYLTPRSFMILRILFGTALIYASAYAKIIHNNLALFTVEKYHLDHLLGFEPHFLVLGAAIVELLIGLFFILGIELRFTALFFLFWLT
ncbi:MAG: hypothetical protein P4L61_04460, partial [Candidatus Pacebacteria bacterium]|nr:hypothetical protein [Candidatus Paceibacterota bacterium]